MMDQLQFVLGKLEMQSYFQLLLDNGFDTWEVLKDITESDMYACSPIFFGSVILIRFAAPARGRLGHRRVRADTYRTEPDNRDKAARLTQLDRSSNERSRLRVAGLPMPHWNNQCLVVPHNRKDQNRRYLGTMSLLLLLRD
ncbi:HMG box protein [Rutstroemia sp. NJR-2017a BVV2]|nr:HMG box protein [Rutstroemia sp. NJR-2017a BVV2]